MPRYRYIGKGVNFSQIEKLVPGSPSYVQFSATNYVDIDAPSASKSDLDAAMSAQGYDYYSTLGNLQTTLGADLVRWFRNASVPAGVTTWECEVGSGDATQAVVANQPTIATFAGGENYLIFDGSAPPDEDYLSAGAIAGLAPYNATDNFLFGLNLYVEGDPSGGYAFYMGINAGGGQNDDSLVLDTGDQPGIYLEMGGSRQNEGGLTYGSWFTCIVAQDGNTGIQTMYIDATAQTTAGAGTMGTFWATNGPVIGTQISTVDRRFQGRMSSMFFAYNASTPFSAATIQAVHDDLAALRA